MILSLSRLILTMTDRGTTYEVLYGPRQRPNDGKFLEIRSLDPSV